MDDNCNVQFLYVNSTFAKNLLSDKQMTLRFTWAIETVLWGTLIQQVAGSEKRTHYRPKSLTNLEVSKN